MLLDRFSGLDCTVKTKENRGFGRVAQRESTPFTRVGSQVQSLSRPPRPHRPKQARSSVAERSYHIGEVRGSIPFRAYHHYCAVMPPSMTRPAPVMKPESSEA